MDALRPIGDSEYEQWARAVMNTYGDDGGSIAAERPCVELDRTLAAFDGDEIIGGAAAYRREMTIPGACRAIAAVGWVGVAPTHRRRGVLTAMMRRQLDDLHRRGEPVAVLNATEAGIYGRFGYGPATRRARCAGETRAMAFRSDVDFGTGSIRLHEPATARPHLERIYDAVRREHVGWVARTAPFWDERLRDDDNARGGATKLRCALHRDADGTPTGYALYRFQPQQPKTVLVVETAATSAESSAALWRFLISIDLHPRIAFDAPVDDVLPHWLADPRAIEVSVVDNLWVRLVDVDRALAARRYAAPVDVVLEVADEFCPWNAGRFRLRGDERDAACQRTQRPADLRLSAAELGAAYLGGTTMAQLAAAGRIAELTPGALRRCHAAFRGDREPFHPSGGAFPQF